MKNPLTYQIMRFSRIKIPHFLTEQYIKYKVSRDSRIGLANHKLLRKNVPKIVSLLYS
jgi:hypothetical protein